jgi:hypothetical protein
MSERDAGVQGALWVRVSRVEVVAALSSLADACRPFSLLMGLPENRRILLKSGVYVREEEMEEFYHVRSNSLGEVGRRLA